MKSDRVYLTHILDSINQITLYSQGGREEFAETRLLQDGIIRNFEVMGEAAKNISPQLKAAHPEIDWQALTDFRNVLIHQYFKVNLEIVWQVVERTLPVLKLQIEQVLQTLGTD